MSPEFLWSGVLTAVIGGLGWFVRSQVSEVSRLQILLNRTREEMAKEYVTKVENTTDINRVIVRLDALDSKMDRMLEKMLVGAGREMQDVSKQLGQWYCAVADISKAETQRKNPTWLDKQTHGTDNIEQQAMDIVIRKKTLLEKEKEIKFMLDYRFGLGTYDEMLGMRRKIRAEREETVYRAMEAKRQIQNNIAITALSLGILGFLGGGIYLIMLATQ